jgi:hypothetical protein
MSAHTDPLKAAIELMEADDLKILTEREVDTARTLALISIAQSLRMLQSTLERSTLVPRVLRNPMVGLP